HPNIVPFIGVEPGNYACIVSEWMDNGDVLSYLEYHPSADRVRLITDIAHGLHYMHSNGLVHGDLHSRNVLVDKVGRARLVDFLLSTTLGTDSLATPTESSSRWVSVLYKAPELLDWAMNPTRTSESDVMNPTRTSESDVYAFGMTTWEVGIV
ncbi:kinase-like protein, partial [Punctularia strigosozonata HHB-11173 SS5]